MPERPLECSDCHRPITVHYTQIWEDNVIVVAHCAECPVLQRKLHGATPAPTSGSSKGERPAGVLCGTCETQLDAVRSGAPLGCAECYEVFSDVIAFELQEAKRLLRPSEGAAKKGALHVGRSPGEVATLSPELPIIALNEALSETLKKEDYEQAAWLRDQIKALKEKRDEGTKG